MKKIFKKIISTFVAASVVASCLCVSASAAYNSNIVYGLEKYKIPFKLELSLNVYGSTAYNLQVTATEYMSKPYYYSSINTKAVIYGKSSTNSVGTSTANDVISSSTSASRGVNESTGDTYGEFSAIDARYGNVSGSLNLNYYD